MAEGNHWFLKVKELFDLIIRSFSRSLSRHNSMVVSKRRTKRHLPVSICQQEYSYSCVAAIAQMVYEFHTHLKLTHNEAIRLTGCEPDGAELKTVAKAMETLCGLTYKSLTKFSDAKRELQRGCLVVSHDEISYIGSHAVLFCGSTRTGIYVCDPNTPTIKWRSDEWIKASGATEFIAIFSRANLPTRCKSAGKRQKAAKTEK